MGILSLIGGVYVISITFYETEL